VNEKKLQDFGGSLAVALPVAVADRLNLGAGDPVCIVETEGGILITPYHPTLARATAAGTRISERYQNSVGKLAA
jgi:antitoxin component of MazEF toxin-antitoxin module